MTAEGLHLAAINAIRCRDLVQAERLLQAAVALAPGLSVAWADLAAVLAERDANDQAADAFRAALRHDANNADILANLAAMLHRLVRDREAVETARRAIAINPDHPRPHMILAESLLRSGELLEGFAEYEWRTRMPGFEQFGRSSLPRPRWNGRDDLARKTLLLHAEQGLGDTIQMARYVPLVARRGGRVVVECDSSLVSLLLRLDRAAQVIARSNVLPPFDLHCPLMSLPHALGTTLDTIPADIPYLTPDPARVAEWRGKIRPDCGRRRIGLAWSGRPTHAADARRSISPELLNPLTKTAGVDWYSLQKDAARLPTNVCASELTDLADTAAMIACLDLVITVDTVVAHLAGAMGRPVWTLLASRNDWRWLTGRSDTPWYPTMRLFRQTRAGDWETVLGEVARELSS